MEKDDEVKGEGLSYTSEWRQYDPRIGRWFSVDPEIEGFVWQSPYAGFNNNPVYFNDPLGNSVTDDVEMSEQFNLKPARWLINLFFGDRGKRECKINVRKVRSGFRFGLAIDVSTENNDWLGLLRPINTFLYRLYIRDRSAVNDVGFGLQIVDIRIGSFNEGTRPNFVFLKGRNQKKYNQKFRISFFYFIMNKNGQDDFSGNSPSIQSDEDVGAVPNEKKLNKMKEKAHNRNRKVVRSVNGRKVKGHIGVRKR